MSEKNINTRPKRVKPNLIEQIKCMTRESLRHLEVVKIEHKGKWWLHQSSIVV